MTAAAGEAAAGAAAGPATATATWSAAVSLVLPPTSPSRSSQVFSSSESLLSVVSTVWMNFLDASIPRRPASDVSSTGVAVAALFFETNEARIGVSIPSRSRKPLVNAAAVICTRPSSELYILRSWRYVPCGRNSPPTSSPGYSTERKRVPSASACASPKAVSSPPHFRMKRHSVGAPSSPSPSAHAHGFSCALRLIPRNGCAFSTCSTVEYRSSCSVIASRSSALISPPLTAAASSAADRSSSERRMTASTAALSSSICRT